MPSDAIAPDGATGLTAVEAVRRLRADPSAYADAARTEARVWGEHFADRTLQRIRVDDQTAAAILRPGRNLRDVTAVAAEHGWRFHHGLSLACGEGRAERHLMKLGVCDSFRGIDISEQAITEARTRAAAEGLAIEYEVADLNSISLEAERYDFVVTQNCLHHVVELERLADVIWKALRPGGRLWIDDFVGETQFQWLDGRLDIVNAVLAVLPERYRNFRLHNFVAQRINRPRVGDLISPFESIRSGEIVPIFTSRFEVEWYREADAIMHLICPVGARRNFTETEDGPAIFELLMLLDRILIEQKVLPPVAAQYVLRKPPDTA